MSDTSAEAARLQASIHRRLPGIERLGIALDMSDLTRSLLRARLQHDHPDWDGAQLHHAMLALTFAEVRSPDR
jgi:hypothetical protein